MTWMYEDDMLLSLDPARDLQFSGRLIYTGRSSIEVAVRMESLTPGASHRASVVDLSLLLPGSRA